MTRILREIWQAGVDAVRGEASVRKALDLKETLSPDCIIAVGKAACDMARPAMTAFPSADTLIITKHGHSASLPHPARVLEAGHPIPDDASLHAGAALLETISQCAPDSHVLMLVSGGASALAEVLPDGLGLTDWREQTDALIASGADIHAINAHRRKVSQIKGGKLLSHFSGRRVTTLAISDVEGDALNVIGSGVGCAPEKHSFDYTSEIVASNQTARNAAENAAGDEPIQANEECLYGDYRQIAKEIGARLRDGAEGLYVFGGEPVVELPANPGRGGRNQALALALAQEIEGLPHIEILVAGTDGTDGPTGDAGAIVDGQTWGPGAKSALKTADAGSYLASKNALMTTGPTGTNVMDLLIARKGSTQE